MAWKGENMNYEEMSLMELKAAAKEKGLKGTTGMRKSELLALLVSVEKQNTTAAGPVQKGKTAVEKEEKTTSVKLSQEKKTASSRTEQQKKAIAEKAVQEEQVSAGKPEEQAEKAMAAKPTQEEKSNRRVTNFGRQNTQMSDSASPIREGENRNSYKGTVSRETTREPSKITRENLKDTSNEKQPRYFQNGNTQQRIQDTSRRTSYQVDNRDGLVNAGRTEDGAIIQVKSQEELAQLDSGIIASGVLEVMSDGFGFIRSNNYMPGDNDVYVSPAQIRKLNLKTGDIVVGNLRVRNQNEKFAALLYVKSINGMNVDDATKRPNFEELTPIFPDERLHLATDTKNVSTRIVDMMSPVGKGQRGMIVAPPKAGKTTLLKEIAKSITKNHKDVYLIILLIDERPEEVTDIKESIEGPNVEVVYSTFDELPEHHKRVSEMVLERAKRLVEYKQDVVILLDSITRLARAYNLVVPPSGRTLSGGLDPAALHMPKRFFGAARNMREGGSLTVLATALIETGSKMDDVIYEEFKGTGNMELTLNRKLQEKRIFPAIDILKSSTRRDDLLLTPQEQEAMEIIRKATSGMRADEAVEQIIDMFARTKDNAEFVQQVKRMRVF